MNGKLFSEALSDETLVKLTDEMLKYERINKNKSKLKFFSAALKIVPAVAAVVLVIGLLNILPQKLNGENENTDKIDNINNTDKIMFNPAVNGNFMPYASNMNNAEINISDTSESIPEDFENFDNFELFLPLAIEKSFFNNKILASITDKREVNKLLAYYTLRNPYNPDSSVRERQKMIDTYPFTEAGAFYIREPNMSQREIDELLRYIIKYTNLTGNDMYQMCKDYSVPLPKSVDPAYSNVRFGDTENILLLDIEWYTYDEYAAHIDEFKNTILPEYRKSDQYIMMSDELKEKEEKRLQENIDIMSDMLNLIRQQKCYSTKSINGKNNVGVTFRDSVPIDMSQHCDSDGYYIWEVYPYLPYLSYYDKDGEYQYKQFDWAYSKSEFNRLVEEQIKPYLDNLLEKGDITQAVYDYTIKDPLQKNIDDFFN